MSKYYQMGASIGQPIYSGEDSSGATFAGYAKLSSYFNSLTLVSGDTIEIPLVEIPQGVRLQEVSLQTDQALLSGGTSATVQFCLRLKNNSIFVGNSSGAYGVAANLPDIILQAGAVPPSGGTVTNQYVSAATATLAQAQTLVNQQAVFPSVATVPFSVLAGTGAVGGASNTTTPAYPIPNTQLVLAGGMNNEWFQTFPQAVENYTSVANQLAQRSTLQNSYYLGILITAGTSTTTPAASTACANIGIMVDGEFAGTL